MAVIPFFVAAAPAGVFVVVVVVVLVGFDERGVFRVSRADSARWMPNVTVTR